MHRIIHLPKIVDPRGNLTFLQTSMEGLPFKVARVFWTYDVPGGETRGGHAFYEQEEMIIALSGSFDVVITDRNGKEERISLNRSYYGLYLPKQTWRHIENFSTNALSLHLVNTPYNADDYIRNFSLLKEQRGDQDSI